MMKYLQVILLTCFTASVHAKYIEYDDAAYYPSWLISEECNIFNEYHYPKNITKLSNYPLDAYNKNVCTHLKPLADSDPHKTQKIDYLTHRYNLFSWLKFIALNREINETYEVTQNNLKTCQKEDCPTPVWLHWRDSESVFLQNGEKPQAWDFTKNFDMLVPLSKVEQVSPRNGNNEKAILIDQANNPIYYQSIISPYLFHFIVNKNLYNLDGQIDFAQGKKWACHNNNIDCLNTNTIGYLRCGTGQFKNCNKQQDLTQYTPLKSPGLAVEIKVAWKILTSDDDKSRYIHTQLPVAKMPIGYKRNVETTELLNVGVVGFHINQKTASSGNWVYSTFSHKDNVWGQTPSFYNRYCPTCPINTATSGATKTQVVRLEKIDPITEAVNQFVQHQLAQENSVLQNYKLIGTQFTTDSSEPLTDKNQNYQQTSRAKLTNFAGGSPHPLFLTNETIETFLQQGNTFNTSTKKLTYKSSSCMNCHANAGIAIECNQKTGKPKFAKYTGDFMFIFSEAKWQNKDKYCEPDTQTD
ncbi:hypothetical protein JF50_18405 [Pseudoalteromonas luteoviolacea]|uniref:Cytochrome c family protein n=1 Tax=Pseudoalteromonas luteoviolacea TaxID=43657 RepID=A0A0C1Q6H4_9GAMM|nr:hypothetical protein [Pseudoalteromonas luteoviolacea]KID56236.1 hypothetical protein JF50_18405 [Pseudoalteromonas luteoviolacea]